MNLPLQQQTFYWHLELSSKCSLACPRCPRTEKPGQFEVTELDLAFIKRVFTQDVLDDTRRILICGGQGDPIYCREMLEIVEYLKAGNPEMSIFIVTNGSYKTQAWWERLANTLNDNDVVTFSADGWNNETNNMYRVNSQFDSIVMGVKTLSTLRPNMRIVWSSIIFSFNENNLDDIKQVATDAGATHFQVVQSSLFGSNPSFKDYIDPALGYDPLEPNYKEVRTSKYAHSDRGMYIPLRPVKRPVGDTLSSSNVTRVYNVLKEQHTDVIANDLIPACVIGERGLYIDAEGIIYPCSWVSHPFGVRRNATKEITWGKSLWVEHKDKFNLHNHSLNEILTGAYWNKLFNSFKDPAKKFVECSQKCHAAATGSRLKNIFRESISTPRANASVTKTVEEYRKQKGDV
jgi:MoaA/NifB/PqqE/SkfB family radical SAM enzyme